MESVDTAINYISSKTRDYILVRLLEDVKKFTEGIDINVLEEIEIDAERAGLEHYVEVLRGLLALREAIDRNFNLLKREYSEDYLYEVSNMLGNEISELKQKIGIKYGFIKGLKEYGLERHKDWSWVIGFGLISLILILATR